MAGNALKSYDIISKYATLSIDSHNFITKISVSLSYVSEQYILLAYLLNIMQ